MPSNGYDVGKMKMLSNQRFLKINNFKPISLILIIFKKNTIIILVI